MFGKAAAIRAVVGRGLTPRRADMRIRSLAESRRAAGDRAIELPAGRRGSAWDPSVPRSGDGVSVDVPLFPLLVRGFSFLASFRRLPSAVSLA